MQPEAPIAAHTQATRSGNLVFLNAQTGRDPATGQMAEGLEAQTRRMLANVDSVLEAFGCTNADIVMTTLMFSDIKFFKAVDVVYAEWLPPREKVPLPACTAFAAAALPANAMVQIEVVAAVPESSIPAEITK